MLLRVTHKAIYPGRWEYIFAENIQIVSLYFAAERPVVRRNDTLIINARQLASET